MENPRTISMEAYSLAGKIYIRAFHFNVLLPEGTTNLVVKKKLRRQLTRRTLAQKMPSLFEILPDPNADNICFRINHMGHESKLDMSMVSIV